MLCSYFSRTNYERETKDVVRKAFGMVFVSLLLIVWSPLFAQERPKVGLALSGGGAKGFAHVGVLKVLEEEGVPIDYITGTSMGSIIGGLYAIGYSVEDLEAIMTQVDWDKMFSGKVERPKLPVQYKQFDGRYLVSLPIQNGKVKLPSGLISDHNILRLFSRLTLPVHGIEDFNDFPIPFACIGADIVTGEAVVLNRGSLAEAMRASMSLPSIFAPVRIGEHLLVDGGIVRNFPVEDVRNMGADLVIGVDVGAPLRKEEELDSFLAILSQSSSFRGAESTQRQRELCDLLILPDITGIALSDFTGAAKIMARGEAAARKMLPQIRALVDSIGRATRRSNAHALAAPDTILVQNVTVEGVNDELANLLKTELRIAPPVRLTVQEIEQAIQNAYNTQYFQRVSYRILPAAEGATLEVHAVAKIQNLFRSALRYDSQDDASVLIGAFFRNVGKNSAFLNLDFRLGERLDLDALYFANPGWLPTLGFSMRLHYTDSFIDLFDGGRPIFRLDTKGVFAEGFLGSIFSTQMAIGFGMRGEYTNISEEIAGADTLSFKKWMLPFVNVVVLETFDKAYFPTRGVRVFLKNEAAVKGLGSDRSFSRHFFDVRGYVPLGKRFAGFGEIMLAGKTGGDLPPHYQFFLGGVDAPTMYADADLSAISFVGLRAGELIGPYAQFAQLGLQAEVFPKAFVIVRANAGNTFEAWRLDFSPNRFKAGLGLTLGADTVIGPVEWSLMRGSGHDFLSHLNIGFKF